MGWPTDPLHHFHLGWMEDLRPGYGNAMYRIMPSRSGFLFWMPKVSTRTPTSCAHTDPGCGGLHNPESFFLSLDHPLVNKIHWCPNCATDRKRRHIIIQRPPSYDDESSRIILNLTLRDGWTLLPPRNNMPRSGFLKKTYKDLQAFANHLGVPLLVSPTAHPIILRPSGNEVDFTDVIHHIEGRSGDAKYGSRPSEAWRCTVRQPPPPPPPKAPPRRAPEESEESSSATAQSSSSAQQRRPHGVVLPNLD